MAVDKRRAKQELDDLLMMLHVYRRDLEAYRDEGDAAEVERCERVLKLAHSRIRKHCAEHGLDLPHDVPSEDSK